MINLLANTGNVPARGVTAMNVPTLARSRAAGFRGFFFDEPAEIAARW
jgi:hypothetical protein